MPSMNPYVKAFSWASKRIGAEGVVAYVTNNSFLEGIAFDGMRKHLAEDFEVLYLLDLGGNIRKGQPGHSNVFGIQVGVSVAILVKTGKQVDSPSIFYNAETLEQSKEQTFDFLDTHKNVGNITWQEIHPMQTIHG